MKRELRSKKLRMFGRILAIVNSVAICAVIVPGICFEVCNPETARLISLITTFGLIIFLCLLTLLPSSFLFKLFKLSDPYQQFKYRVLNFVWGILGCIFTIHFYAIVRFHDKYTYPDFSLFIIVSMVTLCVLWLIFGIVNYLDEKNMET